MRHYKEELILSEIIKILKERRENQGVTHAALAVKAGLSRSAISHIESGVRKPSLLVALRMADALGIQLSDLLREAEYKVK